MILEQIISKNQQIYQNQKQVLESLRQQVLQKDDLEDQVYLSLEFMKDNKNSLSDSSRLMIQDFICCCIDNKLENGSGINDKTLLMLLESLKPYLRNQNCLLNFQIAIKYLQLIDGFYFELKEENIQKNIRNRMEEDFKVIFKMIDPLITGVIDMQQDWQLLQQFLQQFYLIVSRNFQLVKPLVTALDNQLKRIIVQIRNQQLSRTVFLISSVLLFNSQNYNCYFNSLIINNLKAILKLVKSISPHQKEDMESQCDQQQQKWHLFELHKNINIEQFKNDQQTDLLGIQYWIDSLLIQIECLFNQMKPDLVLEIEIENIMELFVQLIRLDINTDHTKVIFTEQQKLSSQQYYLYSQKLKLNLNKLVGELVDIICQDSLLVMKAINIYLESQFIYSIGKYQVFRSVLELVCQCNQYMDGVNVGFIEQLLFGSLNLISYIQNCVIRLSNLQKQNPFSQTDIIVIYLFIYCMLLYYFGWLEIVWQIKTQRTEQTEEQERTEAEFVRRSVGTEIDRDVEVDGLIVDCRVVDLVSEYFRLVCEVLVVGVE